MPVQQTARPSVSAAIALLDQGAQPLHWDPLRRARTRVLIGSAGNSWLIDFRAALEERASAIEVVSDINAAEQSLCNRPYDAFIIGWKLDRAHSIAWLRMVRRRFAKLIVLCAPEHSTEPERISLINAGADAIVTEPFCANEVIVKIESAFQRVKASSGNVYRAGDIEINFDSMLVRRRGKIVNLTPIDFRLLLAMVTAPRVEFSLQELAVKAWGEAADVNNRTIQSHIAWLRRALRLAGRKDPITTLRGRGYRFDP